MGAEELADALVRARAGDGAAIAMLFRALHPRLLRFIQAHEARVADDLAGEVWMGVAAGLGTFDGDLVHFRAWVFSIARRRIADHRRRAMRRGAELVGDDVLLERAGVQDTEASITNRLSAQEAARLVVATLPPDQAEVVLLRVLADLDIDEVAQIMGRSANWVRVTGHRALRRLADRLGTRIDTLR